MKYWKYGIILLEIVPKSIYETFHQLNEKDN